LFETGQSAPEPGIGNLDGQPIGLLQISIQLPVEIVLLFIVVGKRGVNLG
jgi:hypothetical protein